MDFSIFPLSFTNDLGTTLYFEGYTILDFGLNYVPLQISLSFLIREKQKKKAIRNAQEILTTPLCSVC